MDKVVAIIPSRLESTRLPKKALSNILGIPMIVHVYQRCLFAKKLDEVYVATDSIEIKEVVESFGGKVIMTSSEHQTGTDRIAEASQSIVADIIVNVQGDEALVNPQDIDKVVSILKVSPKINVAILVTPFNKKNSPSDIKVVLNENNDVMYLSRADIPSDARKGNSGLLKAYHIVPFRKDFLIEFSKWEKSRLEKIEFNEYLRILEKGHTIKAVHVESDTLSVDTEEDLNYVIDKMKSDELMPEYIGKY